MLLISPSIVCGTHIAAPVMATVILNTLRANDTAKPRELFDGYLSHLSGYFSDFILSGVTQSDVEEVEERPQVHAHDNLGATAFRKYEPSFFSLDVVFQHEAVQLIHLEDRGQFTFIDEPFRHVFREHEDKRPEGIIILDISIEVTDGHTATHITLTLLGIRGNPVPHELMSSHTGDTIDSKGKLNVFQRGLMAFLKTLTDERASLLLHEVRVETVSGYELVCTILRVALTISRPYLDGLVVRVDIRQEGSLYSIHRSILGCF
jgi:hypothetical protein